MKKQTLLAGAIFLSALPTAALIPGCSGGNGGLLNPTATPIPTTTGTPVGTQATSTPTGTSATATPTGTRPTATPTGTTRPTATPTSTTRPTPTPTGTAAGNNLISVTFTAQNGAYFGSSPYTATPETITAEKEGTNGDLSIYSTSGLRYLTLKLRSLGSVKDGQQFNLDGVGSWLVVSGPPQSGNGTGEYNSYGGVGFTSGKATASRNGNVATFTFTNVILKRWTGSTPANSTLTVSGFARVLLPPDAR